MKWGDSLNPYYPNMHKVEWEIVSDIPSFVDGKLFLFKIDLTEGFDESAIPFSSDLTSTELERCHKYRFHKDRVRFSVGRYTVRHLLKSYLPDHDKEIEFQFNVYGKPNVDQVCDIRFNISHSGKYLLIGICKQYEVGVDTEKHNSTIDHLDLAKSVHQSIDEVYHFDLTAQLTHSEEKL